eukprot:TRINITY_DN790_c2_g1_i1.p1 TRINITY_DN790_c2_g1~~TRINITY_DN790_c2_g1_i1.p1  ORF type:complete len:119 (-),score=21.19 TRINITY_DN790_c2_g1_i1:38-394(-)
MTTAIDSLLDITRKTMRLEPCIVAAPFAEAEHALRTASLHAVRNLFFAIAHDFLACSDFASTLALRADEVVVKDSRFSHAAREEKKPKKKKNQNFVDTANIQNKQSCFNDVVDQRISS